MAIATDGIINLNKPPRLTSAKALYRVRAITRVKKSGHAGSLDPAATGVLNICQGKATKLVERIMTLPKRYRAVGRLDVTSVSLDSDSPLEPVPIAAPPTLDQLRDACAWVERQTEQTPPRVSALKLAGVPAYKTVGRESAPPMLPRPVKVYWIHLHAYNWPTLDFEVACGRGTYVRALIRDIGAHLGAGGCLTSLIRTAVGPFTLDDAWTLERMKESNECAPFLIPLDRAIDMIDRSKDQILPRPT